MSAFLRYALPALAILCWLPGCEDPGSVGADLIDERFELLQIDTLKVETSTVLLDSIATQGRSVFLAGSYRDDYLGRVTADGYLALSLGPGEFVVDARDQYGSASLRLKVGYYYGDTTRVQQIRVHRVTETIEPKSGNTLLYNVDELAYDTEVLGEVTFKPEIGLDVEIPISDLLGGDLFRRAQESHAIVTRNEDFKEFLKGLVLVGDDASNTAITGFQTDSLDAVLRIQYTSRGEEVAQELAYEFRLDPGLFFSGIRSERPQPLDQLASSRSRLPSSLTNSRTFIQGGVGFVTRIDLPTIDNLLFIAPNNILAYAFIYVFPVAQTYGRLTPLAQPLVLHVVDANNRIVRTISDEVFPSVDDEFNKRTYYRFDVTSFVQEELDIERLTGQGLIVAPAPSAHRASVDRVVLGGADNRDFRAIVRMLLVEY